MISYVNLQGPKKKDNPGGLAGKFLYAPEDYFEVGGITKPEEITDDATLQGLGQNSTDFTFKEGFGWHIFYQTFDTGEIKSVRQGELDSYSYKHTSELYYPGLKAEDLGLIRIAKNDRFICLFPTPDGKYIQFGDDFYAAYISAKEIGTGKNSTGKRGSMMEIVTMGSGLFTYTGAIEYHPSVS